MGNRVKNTNIVLGLMLFVGLCGSLLEGYQLWNINTVNRDIQNGKLLSHDHFPYQQKFLSAYLLGMQKDYKHAIQSYSQLLETPTSTHEQAKIQFNIGNNLFSSGLNRRVNDDGTLKDEAKYDFTQAKVAYEQSLRLEPASRLAKFNLSLLDSILPQSLKNPPKEQSTMELSNLPIGLP